MTDVALVTGAAGGIGAATARRFAAQGMAVVVADIRTDGAELVCKELAQKGATATPVQLDVTSRPSWEKAIEAAQELGRLTALVNNAGILRDRSLLKMSDGEWAEVIDVHLRGAFLGSQLGLKSMKESGGGAIVSVSSTAHFGSFGQANYSAAKGGIVSLMRTVALEGARHGVRANAIAPGAVLTPMTDNLPIEIQQQFLDGIPLARFADPDEIASAISYLCSPDSSYITGQLLVVDGGATLGG